MMYSIFEAALTQILHTWNKALEDEPELEEQATTVFRANKYRLMAIYKHLKEKIIGDKYEKR